MDTLYSRFVANCGGILGLCMGFSIVTVFEVLHYLSQSLCGKFRNCLSRIRSSSCLDDKQLIGGESPISRQPRRVTNGGSPNKPTDIKIIGGHCAISPPDPTSRHSLHKCSCCCSDGKIDPNMTPLVIPLVTSNNINCFILLVQIGLFLWNESYASIHFSGINLNEFNDSSVTKQLLYAQTNPSNLNDNTVEHRFVTLAQVPTITSKDLANDTLSNISSLRTNETSFWFLKRNMYITFC